MNNNELNELTKKYLMETNDNVIGVSYGYKIVSGMVTNEKTISFRVKEKKTIEQLTTDEIIPKEIKHMGVVYSTDVNQGEVKFLCDAAFYQWETIPPTNRNKIRPLKGGVSTTNYTSMSGSIGTLGFLAIDNEDGSIVGVSNDHVYIDDPFIATERTLPSPVTNIRDDITIQPYEVNYGTNDLTDNIGIVKRYNPFRSPSAWNTVDGSLTTINSAVLSNTESWKQEGLTLAAPLIFASTLEIDNLLSTDPLLYSAGRTTGAKGEGTTKLKTFSLSGSFTIAYHRQGIVQKINFNDCIEFVASAATNPGFICLYPIYAGDSGSALIADFGGTKKIIGLCFAGDDYHGIACRIDNVANELDISAWDGTTPNFFRYCQY